MDGAFVAPNRSKKETIMYSTKTLLTAAALAVVTAAGLGGASAQPFDVGHGDARHDRQDIRRDMRDLHHDRAELYRDTHGYRAYAPGYRPMVERVRIVDTLRFHRYEVVGNPYWVHGRYVVRTHDRFGRLIFVQVDPYSGAFVREVIL
jgi:hypothetical protein